MTTETLTTSLQGLVALVTGAGTGERMGQGAAIAACLARAGARVAVHDQSEMAATATVKQLQGMGADAFAVAGNVADPQQGPGLVQRTIDHFGKIDILVNNADYFGPNVISEEISDRTWNRVLDANLHAPFLTSRAAIGPMRETGYGRIINVGSLAMVRASVQSSTADTASKEALYGLTRHLAVEVTQYGITVNAILPGFTDTPLENATVNEDGHELMVKSIPALRPAKPEETGMLVAFLASPAAGYMTGAGIPVDGGVSILPGGSQKYQALRGQSEYCAEG